tara:strand:+ start:1667 stop:1924 length:258 start_codon:yes stop_codon:yes gene_type:complete
VDLTTEHKGRRAREILEDEVFVEVIDSARTHILTQWNLTDLDQTETRESLYHQGRALDEVLRGLRTLISDWTMDQSRKKTQKGKE